MIKIFISRGYSVPVMCVLTRSDLSLVRRYRRSPKRCNKVHTPWRGLDLHFVFNAFLCVADAKHRLLHGVTLPCPGSTSTSKHPSVTGLSTFLPCGSASLRIQYLHVTRTHRNDRSPLPSNAHKVVSGFSVRGELV